MMKHKPTLRDPSGSQMRKPSSFFVLMRALSIAWRNPKRRMKTQARMKTNAMTHDEKRGLYDVVDVSLSTTDPDNDE